MLENKIFKEWENLLRKGAYRRNDADETFLERMNIHLEKIEPAHLLEPEVATPLVFVVGLPRSGSTIITQLLGHSLDVSLINNLVARFWRAPVTGMHLSKILLGDLRSISFQSDYGKTSDVSEPHEFSYFWQKWLQMENIPPYNPAAVAGNIDWGGLQKSIRNMAVVAGKPLVMKAPDIAYHAERFAKMFPEAIFVHIGRDLRDVAVSLYKGRKEYYGDENVWLGAYPLEYEQIANLPGKAQIAAQVYYLDRLYRSSVAAMDASRAVFVELRDMCADPMSVVDQIGGRVSSLGGNVKKIGHVSADELRFSTYVDSCEFREFGKLLCKYQ